MMKIDFHDDETHSFSIWQPPCLSLYHHLNCKSLCACVLHWTLTCWKSIHIS